MRDRVKWIVIVLLALPLLVACTGGNANGDDPTTVEIVPPGLSVRDAWIRPAILPEGSPTPDQSHEGHDEDARSGVISAMYLVIENSGAEPVQLVEIVTPAARIVELHETQNQNGLLRMRPVESVDVPARGQVTFEPGGLHVMLVDVTGALEAGDTVPVTLVFNTGERLELPDVPVQES